MSADSSLVQLISSIVVALITGIVSVVVAYIQVSKKEVETPSIVLPRGVILQNKRFPIIWIIVFVFLGGAIGYLGSGYFKSANDNRGEVIIIDDFSKKSSYWITNKVESKKYVSQSYQINNTYFWELSGFDKAGVSIEPEIPILTNFEYSIDIKQVKGSNDITYGILFRSNSADGWYLFGVKNNGIYNLMLYQPDKIIQLISWTKSSAIDINSNTLRVIANEDNLELYINNSLVSAIVDNSSRYGKIGIYVGLSKDDNAAFEIDNFEIKSLK